MEKNFQDFMNVYDIPMNKVFHIKNILNRFRFEYKDETLVLSMYNPLHSKWEKQKETTAISILELGLR